VAVNKTESQHFVFCLYPGLPLFCIASALDVLRHANRHLSNSFYTWSFVTENNDSVVGSNGLPISPTMAIENTRKTSRIFLVAGFDPEQHPSPHIMKWLKRRAHSGLVIGGISNGGFILARHGLLDGYQATVHFEDFSSFCAIYPDVDARYQRFVIDRNRMTCSGGAATLDLFIELVRQDHGSGVANWISRQMLLHDLATTTDVSGNHVFDGSNRYSPRVQRALALLDASVHGRMTVSTLARSVGLSRRELLRLFRHETGRTPTAILNERRLERARSLVLHSHLPLIAIADSVGYSSQSHLTRSYREFYSITPARDRARTRMAVIDE
jgi:transcriptional regulator GlxA family with amidase domain